MSQRIQSLTISDMHCTGCESVIENAVKQLPGITAVNADFSGDRVVVGYDDTLISIDNVIACIKTQGYQVNPEFLLKTASLANKQLINNRRTFAWIPVAKKVISVAIAMLGIGVILWLDSWVSNYTGLPQFESNLSYSLLIMIGFLTSFHCVGMCGPLILSYTARSSANGQHAYSKHLLYGMGKTLSYTVIGALFGAFGSIVAFTPFTQGIVGAAAGLFLVLFGLHMLEVFPELKHFQIKTPALVRRFVSKEYRKHSNPFIIGLLNGLMIICGPLQAMYVMAAGTGSWMDGAAILCCFGMGTLPLLLSFGFFTSLLSANMTPKMLRASGIIVIILGAIMLNRGLAVTGTGLDFNAVKTRISQELMPKVNQLIAKDSRQTIHMEVTKNGFTPNQFILRKGVPVKWIINVKEQTECNRVILVSQHHLKIDLKPGLQTVEFIPSESGIVSWSCWMGMIPGTFIVQDDKTADNHYEFGTQYQQLLAKIHEIWAQLVAFYKAKFFEEPV